MLVSMDQCAAFLAAAVLITLSPGPDNLMVISLGMSRGRAQGVAFGLGCALGCLSHTLLAALGVSALIAASPAAFGALKLCGGGYLVWLGIQALRHRGSVDAAQTQSLSGAADSVARFFAKGALVNAINPKVVIFFLSFLPQFVDAGCGQVTAQTAVLGGLFTAQACVIFGLLGYFSGAFGQWLGRHARAGVWLHRVSGVIFLGLGARLLLLP